MLGFLLFHKTQAKETASETEGALIILARLCCRHVDRELELVWKSASADNKRMRSTVRDKGAMFDSDSDPNGHVSSEEEEAR